MALDPVAMNRASAALGRLAAVGAAGLVLTGLPLVVLYRPTGGASWLTTLHSLSSMLFLGAAAGMLLAAVAAALVRERTWVGWPLALVGFVVAGAGALTGQLIAWDSVALPVGVVGDAVRGVIEPLTDDVRHLVVDGAEISPGAFLGWTVVHVAVLPAGAVAAGRLLWRRLQAWDALQDDAVSEVAEPQGPAPPPPGESAPS